MNTDLLTLCDATDIALGGSPMGIAPLPLMEAAALRLFHQSESVRARCARVPSPIQWRAAGGDKVIAEARKEIYGAYNQGRPT
jgi:hypothetical protein